MGFSRLTPSFFINQNEIVLVKKINSQTGCNRVFDQVFPGQPAGLVESPRFLTFLIFFKPSSVPILDQLGLGSTHWTEPSFKIIRITCQT
jgi:hypothetical protein